MKISELNQIKYLHLRYQTISYTYVEHALMCTCEVEIFASSGNSVFSPLAKRASAVSRVAKLLPRLPVNSPARNMPTMLSYRNQLLLIISLRAYSTLDPEKFPLRISIFPAFLLQQFGELARVLQCSDFTLDIRFLNKIIELIYRYFMM